MKGSCLYLGAEHLRRLSTDLEQHEDAVATGEISAVLDELETAFATTRSALAGQLLG
ncbi:MAG: hypothetical protein WKF94_11140 [Solirubrobacteraceae bacterium]